MTDMPKTETGLTEKQEAFARFVACDGMTHTDAYRNAYDVGPHTKPETVHWEAWEVSAHPKVSQRIRQLREAQATEINWGIKQAFDQLKADRKYARKNESAAAAVSATKGQMRLLGLDKQTIAVQGASDGATAHMSEKERLDALELQIPVLIPLMRQLGYEVTKIEHTIESEASNG